MSVAHTVLGAVILSVALGGCSSSTNSGALDLDVGDLLPFDSEPVRQVKEGSVKACPLSTLGDMADGFLSNPDWSDFTSLSGETVVELTGGMSYDGVPTQLTVQFPINTLTGSFEVGYVELGGVGQNILVTSVLLTKMCEAT